MTPYHSALDPSIVTGRHEPIGDPRQKRGLARAGLLEAIHLAMDLVALELIQDRIKGLNAAPVDRSTIRIAVNLGAPEETYLPSVFREDEPWTAACGYGPKTIFWRELHREIEPEIARTISQLIEPAIARAPAFSVAPVVLLAFAQTEPISNHQRMKLLRVPHAMREAIYSPRKATS